MIERCLKGLGCGFIGWITVATAHAAALDEGLAAFRRGDEAAALKHWQADANQGHLQAQFYLSVLYGNDKGEVEDKLLSIRWLTLAADGGYAPAQFNLGNHLFQGRWVAPDMARARYWWQLAAEQGWEGAQYNLGKVYFQGVGVEKNLAQARYWLDKAASSGSQPARQLLTRLELESAAQQAAVEGSEDAPAVNGEARLTEGGLWVKAQKSGHFTLQLLATEDFSACLGEVTRLQRETGVNLHSVSIQSKGRRFCAVLYGRYQDSKAARDASSGLKQKIGISNAWIRTFGSLQKILN